MTGAIVAILLCSVDLTLAEINEHKARWIALAPRSCSYELQPAGYIDGRVRLGTRVSLLDRRVASAELLFRPGPGDTFVPPREDHLIWSMEDVFDAMAASARRGDRVRAMFDEKLGHVIAVFVESEREDGGWTLEIRDFTVHDN